MSSVRSTVIPAVIDACLRCNSCHPGVAAHPSAVYSAVSSPLPLHENACLGHATSTSPRVLDQPYVWDAYPVGSARLGADTASGKCVPSICTSLNRTRWSVIFSSRAVSSSM